MKFAVDLIEDLELGEEYAGVTVMRKVVGAQSRWSQFIEVVVKFKGKFYLHEYEVGLTEMQEVERNTGDTDCPEVFPHVVEVTEYRRAP